MDEDLQALVIPLAHKTGLEALTVEDLLSRGWRYVENLGEIARWEHPMWQLKDTSKVESMYEILGKPVND